MVLLNKKNQKKTEGLTSDCAFRRREKKSRIRIKREAQSIIKNKVSSGQEERLLWLCQTMSMPKSLVRVR